MLLRTPFTDSFFFEIVALSRNREVRGVPEVDGLLSHVGPSFGVEPPADRGAKQILQLGKQIEPRVPESIEDCRRRAPVYRNPGTSTLNVGTLPLCCSELGLYARHPSLHRSCGLLPPSFLVGFCVIRENWHAVQVQLLVRPFLIRTFAQLFINESKSKFVPASSYTRSVGSLDFAAIVRRVGGCWELARLWSLYGDQCRGSPFL